MHDDSFIFETARRPETEMGVVGSAISIQLTEVSEERKSVSTSVAAMEKFDASHLAEVTRNLAEKLYTRNFDFLESTGVVELTANRSNLHPEESLRIVNDETDIRNFIPSGIDKANGSHEKYIEAITQEKNTDNATISGGALIQPETKVKREAVESEVALQRLREAVNDQFALAA